MLRKNNRNLCVGFPVHLFDKTGPNANARRYTVTGISVPVIYRVRMHSPRIS